MVRITQQKGFLLIGLNMLVNCACSLTFKWQSKIKVYGESFTHPFIQTLTMFIGEALCFLIFLAYKNVQRENYDKELKQAEEEGKSTKFNVIYVIIPTIFDMITSCLAFFALGLMPVSVYSMIRGTSIVMTAIFQIVFLKRWPLKVQLFGMFLIIIGNLIVGIVVYLKSENDGNNLIIGVIFLLFSFMTTSGQLIIEEKYFDKYYLNAFQLVGLEGIWGILFTIIMLFGLEFIPCPDAFKDGCPKGDNGNYYLEQSISFLQIGFDLNNSDYQPQLFLSILGGCFTILLMNSVSMLVLQYLSALTKNVVQVSTITLVWSFSLFFGWEKFYWQQLIGFLILICGSLIYNKVISVPCLNQPEKEVSDESLIKEESTSLQQNQN